MRTEIDNMLQSVRRAVGVLFSTIAGAVRTAVLTLEFLAAAAFEVNCAAP